MTNKRRAERSDDGVHCRPTVTIQLGMKQRVLTPKLIDHSTTGVQFQDYIQDEVLQDRTAIIELWFGDPPKKHVVEGRIAWIELYGGMMSFGCEFFDEQPQFDKPT